MITASERACIAATRILLVAAMAFCPPLSTTVFAQASGMAGISATETQTLTAKVTAIDQTTRMVTLVGPQGQARTLKIGDEVRNLPQVRVGDTVNVLYRASITYVLAPPGTKLPGDSVTVATARAAPGQMPAAAMGTRIVTTATVVGVDLAAHSLRLVDPAGGLVRSVDVVSPAGQQSMKMIKVGDTITGVASEAIAVAVEPAG
jgi:hypothetical protein